MSKLNLSQNHIRLLGLALILAGLLLNQWTLTALFSSDGVLSPHSVVIIWITDVVLVLIGLVLAISGSFGTLLNALVGVGITALLLYGLELFYYRLNHPTAPPEANAAPPPAISLIWEAPSFSCSRTAARTRSGPSATRMNPIASARDSRPPRAVGRS